VLASTSGPDELPAGDFVRWCKQLLDLLDQIVAVAGIAGADSTVGAAAREADAAIRRSVVAYSGVS
jgi:ATP-dependent RNA helicase HelY